MSIYSNGRNRSRYFGSSPNCPLRYPGTENQSPQYHHKRSEAWVIVRGIATVTLNDKEIEYKEGEIVDIPVGMKHRVPNNFTEDLIFIKTQTGTYFGEDDIVRLSDNYG